MFLVPLGEKDWYMLVFVSHQNLKESQRYNGVGVGVPTTKHHCHMYFGFKITYTPPTPAMFYEPEMASMNCYLPLWLTVTFSSIFKNVIKSH